MLLSEKGFGAQALKGDSMATERQTYMDEAVLSSGPHSLGRVVGVIPPHIFVMTSQKTMKLVHLISSVSTSTMTGT